MIIIIIFKVNKGRELIHLYLGEYSETGTYNEFDRN
jgi:hypothetical protein